jgi:peptidoglycan/LPS O-acetylase OafA/YrhL
MNRSPGTAHRPGPERLAGVDLMRGFGAFGVICVHIGIVAHNHTSPAGFALQKWFDFVVAFFLITALFFALRGEKAKPVPWGAWLYQRFERLMIPYFIWSALYLALHVLKLHLGHQSDAIRSLFQDPVGLLLNGGTSLALYFLPLLFVSLIVAHALRHFLATAPVGLLVLILVMASAASSIMINTGNSYDLGTARGFEPALPGLNDYPPCRLLLALLADAVRSLPLIVTAALLVRILSTSRKPAAVGALLLGVAALAVPPLAAWAGLSPYVPEVVAGTGAFLVGWALPVSAGKMAVTLGAFSYGVYLVHQVILETMQVAGQKLGIEPPFLTLGGVIVLSLLVYGLSMAIVGAASQGGPFLRRLFALR